MKRVILPSPAVGRLIRILRDNNGSPASIYEDSRLDGTCASTADELLSAYLEYCETPEDGLPHVYQDYPVDELLGVLEIVVTDLLECMKTFRIQRDLREVKKIIALPGTNRVFITFM